MQDEKIIELYFDRDERAIEETAAKYENYLFKIAMNVLSDTEDSRECVNDSYFAAWESIPPARPARLSGYLGKITRRISIDRYRYKTRDKRKESEYALSLDELGECITAPEGPEAAVEIKLLTDSISRFLYTQPRDRRVLFLMRYYFLDSLSEAAERCGIGENKAKKILFGMRNSLREHLIKEGFLQ